jgi:cation diffusion facilitator family transporter
MSHTATPEQVTTSHNAKRSAALFSVLAAFAVTAFKLLTGLLTGSLGMLSEAAHSGIDLVAAGITLFSVQVSDRPADADHTYGHGKIESLSAGVETVLMLASCIWILTEAVSRILFREHLSLKFSLWPFVALLLSITVDFTRSRKLQRIARETRSEALEADAIHFGTDIWSSLAVLFGLAATYLGERWRIPQLELADPIAAILVACIILHVTWKLARRTIDTLTDAAPVETRGLVRELASIDGVLSVDRVRTRRSGPSYFADVTLGMPRNLTFQRSEQITATATAAVQRHLPGADVVVHSIPIASLTESVHDRIRAVAARSNLAIHDVSVQEYNHQLHVEQHLEVGETMSLRDAHAIATQLESDMRREVPEISSILTHIESEPATIERPASLERDRQLEVRLRRAAQAFPEILDIHEVFVTRTHSNEVDRIQVNCHCTLPDDLPMSRVHEIITALENSFKLDAPEVSRLLIHPEPATDNRR